MIPAVIVRQAVAGRADKRIDAKSREEGNALRTCVRG